MGKLENEIPPPNDWHSWFYALLNITLHRFFPSVRIERELVLGAQPPRADFVIIRNDASMDLRLRIFRDFRKHNILEFKSPDDSLDESVLWKVVGYAGFYISAHKKKISADEVTLTLFRAAKPEKLLREMEAFVREDGSRGIYHIEGWKIGLPLRIIVTSELEGPEYAGFRTVSKNPRPEDIWQLLEDGKRENDPFALGQYRAFFEILAKLDSEQTEEAKRRFADMARTWMDVFKPEIDAAVQKGREEGWQKGQQEGIKIGEANILFGSVQDGEMRLDYAAKKAGLTPALFSAKMEEAGYTLPQTV